MSFDGITAGSANVTHYNFGGGTTSAPATSQWARQLEARYLYVLMCLTCDLGYLNAHVGDPADRCLAATARVLPNGRSTR